MEFDYSKLRGRIVEKYGTIGNFCDEFGITQTAMSDKLNNRARFKQTDIMRIVSMLDIDFAKIPEYFFTEKRLANQTASEKGAPPCVT